MVPREVQTRDEITFIRDLMGADRKSWDATIVTANFPGDICNKILSLPIATGEQDVFVWAPCSKGNISIRSSYRANNAYRFSCGGYCGILRS